MYASRLALAVDRLLIGCYSKRPCAQNLQIGILRFLFRPLIYKLSRCNDPPHNRQEGRRGDQRASMTIYLAQYGLLRCHPWVCILHEKKFIIMNVNTPLFDQFHPMPERNHRHDRGLCSLERSSPSPKWLHFFRSLHVLTRVIRTALIDHRLRSQRW